MRSAGASQLTGQKWSFIACALPGRTDDAVRNRYLRLQKKMHAAAACSNKAAVTSEDLAEVQATKKGDMWTVEEDARIIEGVQHHGFKWQQVGLSGPEQLLTQWVLAPCPYLHSLACMPSDA